MTRLNDVNTTDLAGAIRLGCETMQRIFNPDDDHRPHFMAWAKPDDKTGFGFAPSYTEAHVPGRHLYALLLAREALGVEVDPRAIDNHRRAAYFSFGGAAPFPLNRDRLGGELVNFADHNIREGMFACYALTHYLRDDRAHEIGERCIQGVFERWSPQRGWDMDWLHARGLKLEQRTFVWGLARSIGPLVRFHQATGSPRALELAQLLADKATREFFTQEGVYDPARFARHTHSTTCTLSSLAILAEHTRDNRLMDRVRTFYDRGLKQITDETGWVVEMADPKEWNPDRGEINNTGDNLETALILARHGRHDCYDDSERAIRCHLLPAQLRDTSFIVQPTGPQTEDGKRDVARRMRGAFGFPAPYGHLPINYQIIEFCLDIVGGGVSSLCHAWENAVVHDETGTRVNLLFDRDRDGVCVESPYTHPALRVTVRRPGPLAVRIPPWVDRKSLRIEGAAGSPRWQGDFARFDTPPVNTPITFHFALPVREFTLRHHIRPTRVRLRGDEVLAMDNHGADLTFFPPIDG